ncbi:selenoneine biosynthesis selenosugar synthase SenB [Halomonas sp.]|uniref:selenoneine biosynthesis selenosugar synthase SenB n=1 Tax=Halomonas sp. TaxID=1486246 RepID=UPI0035696977
MASKGVAPKIALITPAGRQSRAGNRATATRWARFLGELGCRVRVTQHFSELAASARDVDLMIALHAWRSHDSIRDFREAFPEHPLILALTGTDLYRFQHSHVETVMDSLRRADALIGLHDRVKDDLPKRFHARLHIVVQSALPLPPGAPGPGRRYFDVLVVGHLREEKDSLRAALAVRDLPEESRLRVIQLGGAHSDGWARAAREEMARNPRYQWLGDLAHWRVRQWMARARLMVISSHMEGGANVVSEACVAGLPVIASEIPGNRGLLGDDYPGVFPVGDTGALRSLLLQAERSPAFLDDLRQRVNALAPRCRPEAEREALARVLEACKITTRR